MQDWLKNDLETAAALHRRLTEGDYAQTIERICAAVVRCFEQGGKLLTVGNGGSATDALHLTEELIGRYRSRSPRRPLPAVCLAADPTALTCIANDFGFDNVFARQVEGLCQRGDVLVAFTTSGNSPNINLALSKARELGGVTLGLLGGTGGEALALCDLAIVVPGENSARAQEIHTLILHLICEAVERRFGQ